MDCYVILMLLPPPRGKGNGAMLALAYAFRVGQNTSQKLYKQYLSNKCNTNRKERKDKGKTIINLSEKHTSVITELHVYKKEQYLQTKGEIHLNGKELKKEFDNLPVEKKNIQS